MVQRVVYVSGVFKIQSVLLEHLQFFRFRRQGFHLFVCVGCVCCCGMMPGDVVEG